MPTPKELIDEEYQESLIEALSQYNKRLKTIQDKCQHPEKDRKKTGGSHWSNWPDYGFTPGTIKCGLCGKKLDECYDNYIGS